ncbi:hypothetical protein NIES2104_09100 [Leptolyngbya sp. NIES-2104]|nr:hypothetical protein NIES2104_09100 [Leptolyngbya sp. NIES-2104]
MKLLLASIFENIDVKEMYRSHNQSLHFYDLIHLKNANLQEQLTNANII